MTISTVFSEFLEDHTFSENTVKAYETECRKLLHFLKEDDIELLTKRNIKRYFNLHVSKFSPRTQSRSLAFLKSFTTYMMAYDYVETDITAQVKIAPINKDIRANHSIHQQTDIYTLLDNISDLEDQAIVGIALLSGLRLSEIETLCWRDVHPHHIHVRDGKGRKDRYVALSPTLERILHNYRNSFMFNEDSFLFISSRGLRMSGKTISRRIKKYTGTNPHSCRVTFATSLIRNGCDIETLRANMGHSSISTTQSYIDRSKMDAVDAARQFLR